MFHWLCGQSHKTVSINHNFWRERRAEADRTEALLLTSLTPYARPHRLHGVKPLYERTLTLTFTAGWGYYNQAIFTERVYGTFFFLHWGSWWYNVFRPAVTNEVDWLTLHDWLHGWFIKLHDWFITLIAWAVYSNDRLHGWLFTRTEQLLYYTDCMTTLLRRPSDCIAGYYTD